jgi:RNA polymerase sigma-70 factor, ECF subfamily
MDGQPRQRAVRFWSGLRAVRRCRALLDRGLRRGMLGPDIREVLEQARRRWPSVTLEATAFASYLEERLEGSPEPTSLDHVQKLDLFLACACAQGQAAAIRAFNELYLPKVTASLRALRAQPGVVDHVISRLSEELFKKRSQAPPRITEYMGRSSLQAWLQVVAMRAYLLLGRESCSNPMESAAKESLAINAIDPELSHLEVLYRDAFKTAFQEAAQNLSSRQRNLLRYQYVESMTAEEIASLYGVEREAAVRWQEGARKALLEATRERLVTNPGIDRREHRILGKLVERQIDSGIRELFAVGND